MEQFFNILMNLAFPIVLTIAELLLSSRSPKRKYWYLGILSYAVFFIVFYFTSTNGNYWLDCLRFFLTFCLSLGCLALVYQGNFYSYLYLGTMAYCVEHISQRTSVLLRRLFLPTESNDGYFFLLSFLVTAFYTAVTYFLFTYKLQKNKVPAVKKVYTIFIAAGVLIVTTVLSLMGITHLKDPNAVFYIEVCFSLISVLSAAVLEITQMNLEDKEREAYVLKQMLHDSKRAYEESKKSVELINIKCHDLKHLLNNASNRLSPEEVNTLKKEIALYDQNYQTGNEALDVILTEKGMNCAQKGIRMTSFVDGRDLDKMKSSDIYFFFENALENAIRCVQDYDEEHRTISIYERTYSGYHHIYIENYALKPVRFNKDNLPITNRNPDYHGYGIRSMASIAQSYNGLLSCSREDNIYRVDLSLPLAS